MGGKFHLKLNIGERPIANKYSDGKMKRTLKESEKVREIVEREGHLIRHGVLCPLLLVGRGISHFTGPASVLVAG